MYNKPVVSEVIAADSLLHKGAAYVYWVSIEPKDSADVAAVVIRDGWDTAGNEIAHFATAQGAMFNCIPPIHCTRGLFIDVDGEVRSCTVGYLPEKVALARE